MIPAPAFTPLHLIKHLIRHLIEPGCAFLLLNTPNHLTLTPELGRSSRPARSGIARRRARIGDAVVIAERVLHVVVGQDAVGGVVAALVDEMDGYAAAGAAAVLEDGVREGSDLR